MELVIDNKSRIGDIQSQFTQHFPYLKLEFFGYEKNPRKIYTTKNRITDAKKTLGELRLNRNSGPLSINGHQKVSTLENNFRDLFGLNVQVSRKSGLSWLMTSATDDWTLSKQNKMGEEMDRVIKIQSDLDFDAYHEQA